MYDDDFATFDPYDDDDRAYNRYMDAVLLSGDFSPFETPSGLMLDDSEDLETFEDYDGWPIDDGGEVVYDYDF